MTLSAHFSTIYHPPHDQPAEPTRCKFSKSEQQQPTIHFYRNNAEDSVDSRSEGSGGKSRGLKMDEVAESAVYEGEGVSNDRKGAEGLSGAMEVLSVVDLDLECSSEKLVNLRMLLSHALAWDEFEEMGGVDEGSKSEEFVEKALVFDLLSGFLDGEALELERNVSAMHVRLVDVRERISLCGEEGEMLDVGEEKLRVSKESLNQFREKVMEMKKLSANLQRSVLAFRSESGTVDDGMGIAESPLAGNSIMQTDNQRDILRMLEKSLATELDLEKKFLEAREHEEELKRKLHYTEQVLSHMEEVKEAAWGKSLEADHAAEVLLCTSREILNRLQIVQFQLSMSLHRENDLKTRLENCVDQLKVKDELIKQLQAHSVTLETGFTIKREKENRELHSIREKLKLLEGKLNESEARSQTSTTGEVENTVDSLRETIAIAESRVERAEAKVTLLTETNLELTEELGFLKSNDPNVEKITLLEKQMRDLEIQLQYKNAANEASQEQQTLLYTAIWDMETLIEDLKSKVSNYESKIESTKEQCLLLSESNFELNKELSFLRDRLEFLEASLGEANSEKLAISTDINIKSKLIMDMVAQIAAERERVQKQLATLAEENKALAEKLRIRSKSYATAPHIINGKLGP